MIMRSLAVHGGILLLAGALALRTYTIDDDAGVKHAAAEVWGGSPSQVTMVRFEHKVGEMTIEPRQDKQGVYFVGTVVKDPEAEEPKKKDPHANIESAGSEEAEGEPEAEAKTEAGGKVTANFIAVGEGEELLKKLAPLQVLRVLGKVDDARKTDFGFDQIEGSLYVSIGGKDHTLVFGGATPGGSDRYARDPATGNAYVVPGAIFRDLTSADQRLVERDLHGFDPAEVKRVTLTVGDTKRELVRSDGKKDFWSRPEAPEEKDETASNWMTKIDRLRVTSYAGDSPQPPVKPGDLVIKVEYFDERRPIGYLELVRREGLSERTEYLARTEHTRWYAGVLRSTAEQVDQDVKSVVAP